MCKRNSNYEWTVCNGLYSVEVPVDEGEVSMNVTVQQALLH